MIVIAVAKMFNLLSQYPVTRHVPNHKELMWTLLLPWVDLNLNMDK